MLAIIGTRPEAIKLAPVVRATGCDVMLTGQHPPDLVRPVLEFFEIQPYHGWLTPERRHFDNDGDALTFLLRDALFACNEAIYHLGPDKVIVQGDTTSALAGALAAFHRQIPVAHVEAGLRTYDLTQPFPEEANRQIIARLATWHFCPTKRAEINLLHEGPYPRIHVTGNTVVDALEWARDKIGNPVVDRKIVLVTVHRRENHEHLDRIADTLERISRKAKVLLCLHPNPAVKEAFTRRLMTTPVELMGRENPLPYDAFLTLLNACYLVLTDSGGVQEEAACFNKPCLVLRDVTERREGIEAGCARLVGTDPNTIVDNVELLLSNEALHEKMASAPNPYGDGHAAERIAEVLK